MVAISWQGWTKKENALFSCWTIKNTTAGKKGITKIVYEKSTLDVRVM